MSELLEEIKDLNKNLANSKSSVSTRSSTWISIGISIGVLLLNLGLMFGVIQTNLNNHINNGAVHVSALQASDIVRNTDHRVEFNHKDLDATYVRQGNFKALEKRVEKLEEGKKTNDD